MKKTVALFAVVFLAFVFSVVMSIGVFALILLGDVNGDGNVDPMDASLVLRYDAGLCRYLPW